MVIQVTVSKRLKPLKRRLIEDIRPPHNHLRRTLLAALGTALTPVQAHALPVGGQVSAGSASIAGGAGSVNVTQSSSRAVIDWSSFNIGTGEAVRFSQPSASSIALNRIHDSSPSQIDGSLTANGQVWLVNPNGVVFGHGAQVNAGGLVATASAISNNDFMAGNYAFTPGGNPDAVVSNAGTLTVADTGLAALVAPQVANSGTITARLGKVALGSGDSFALDLYGDGLLSLGVSNAVARQLVSNGGIIQADGGQVTLTAAAASQVVSSVINMDGVIQARHGGRPDGRRRDRRPGQQRRYRQQCLPQRAEAGDEDGDGIGDDRRIGLRLGAEGRDGAGAGG